MNGSRRRTSGGEGSREKRGGGRRVKRERKSTSGDFNKRGRGVNEERREQNIKDEETGKVLDISGSDFRAGTEVILWTKNGGENQAWYLKQDLPASNGKSFKMCIFGFDRGTLCNHATILVRQPLFNFTQSNVTV